jgi:aromatic ring hydroxylase
MPRPQSKRTCSVPCPLPQKRERGTACLNFDSRFQAGGQRRTHAMLAVPGENSAAPEHISKKNAWLRVIKKTKKSIEISSHE